MKHIAAIALHYGKEYLAWAVEAADAAELDVHIFYSPTPSYGFADPAMRCPDSEDELVAAANSRIGPRSVIWHRVENAHSEQVHRDQMLELARGHGAATMTVIDADEIWDPACLALAIQCAYDANRAGRWLARFHNFWRSWKWTVRDSFRPVRIVDLRHPLTADAYLTEDMQPLPVYHFGYAQSVATMSYKLSCHGHRSEFKPGWFGGKFLGWTPAGPHDDLHPCVNNLWTAEPTDALTLAKAEFLLEGHPYRGLDVIP